MTYRQLLIFGETALRQNGIGEAASDAWILFEFVTGIDRTHYFLCGAQNCPQEQERRYRALIRRRNGRIPVQYLTGVQEFMGLPFAVDERVLIPRQDTELLVTEALARIRPGNRVLDLCTGSGCVIISLKKRLPIRACASDISEDALELARQNAKTLGAEVEFVKSDLLDAVPGIFDCIVSNPPYIASGKIAGLMPEVARHEPRAALDGGADGLDFYRRIIARAGGFLIPGGWLLFEIGFDQGDALKRLLETAGYREVTVKKDLAGLDRVAAGRRPGGE